ncbi:MAG: hypothetical protein Q4A01_06560 [Coriobacteriales bacterium]|nr:hypothetical protein [Coriobacteriales bacterium]
MPCKLVLYDTAEGNKGTIAHKIVPENRKLGCGVQVTKGGEFVMKGGNIANNTGVNYGGGVDIDSGSFTMEGGTIRDNTGEASLRGGGVAIRGGTFTMEGGTIRDNGYSDGFQYDVQYGGGVYVGKNGTFNLNGGTITRNHARRGGGVACLFDYHISVSGSPQVTDNQALLNPASKPMGDNLCLMWRDNNSRTPITIGDTLGKDAKIGISIIQDNSLGDSEGSSFEYTDGVFTKGYKATQSTDPWHYFTSDNPDDSDHHLVLWTPDGQEAQLAVARYITVAPGITGGTVTPGRDVAAERETIAIQATPNEGWELVSVTAKDAEGNDVPVKDNKELAVPASNVVIYATFKEKPKPPAPAPAPTPTPAYIHVTYTAHVQQQGDLPAVSDGEVAGTTGESKRLEAMSATVDAGGVEYRAHLQGKGWDSWVADGKQAGTAGESRRIEAIQMRLTGAAATDGYHVWYRVHSQTYGWLGWACDGEPAGTAGMSKRAEAYQVVVLQGNQRPADYDASNPAYQAQAVADAHLQGSGWTGRTSAGRIGTTGESRRMEGLRLYAPDQPFAGGIAYQVHEQQGGWTAEQSDGELAGTTGKSRRIEAVRICLTGELADHLSVWYRVHSQTYGWSGWACNGEPAGTEGMSKRAEAVDLRILPKGAPAPGSTHNAFRSR